MGDILSIGLKSLMTYQSALTTTAQNISNANTDFYSRRIVDFKEAIYNNGVE